jgi:uncharacterized RDD family membrane protein YckC
MPTTAEFWSVAEQVAHERGCLIVGFGDGMNEPELGSTLDSVLGFRAPQAFTVVARAEWSEWLAQAEAFYRLRPGWGRGKDGDRNVRYYRVRSAAPQMSFEATTSSTELGLSPTFGTAAPSFSGYALPQQGLMGATFAPRAVARIIDYVLHYFLGIAAGLLFHFILVIASGGQPPLWVLLRISHAGLPVFATAFLGFLAYQITCTTLYGSTLGKLICSLQVLQDDGSPCRLWSALIRELGYFVDALFFGLIGYAAMRGTDQQQRYGDEWAGTIVCKKSDVPEKSRRTIGRFVIGLMVGALLDIALLMVGLLVQISY